MCYRRCRRGHPACADPGGRAWLGTVELRGISGTGGFESSGETTTYTLDH
jgi:hypothetical protein